MEIINGLELCNSGDQQGEALVSAFVTQAEPKRSDYEHSLGKVLVLYLQNAAIASRSARNNVLSIQKIFERVRGAPIKPETIPLSEVNESLLTRFQAELVRLYCEQAAKDDAAQREARERALRTSRSMVTQARSIFSSRGEMDMPKLYRASGIELPGCVTEPDGFLHCKIRGKATKRDYRAPADSLVEQSFDAIELMRGDAPVYLGFWFAAGLGLRRKEIRYARWEHVQEINGRGWYAGGIGKDNLEIHVPWQTRAYAAIQPFRKADGWVMEERGDAWCRRLSAWMRGQGWETEKTLHELRAWLGSKLYAKSPVSAMRQLRHKSIGVTERNYVRYQLNAETFDVL